MTRRVPAGVLAGTLAVFLAFAASSAVSAQSAITLDDWIGRLNAASTAASQGEVSPSADKMTQVRQALGLPVAVSTPSGTTTVSSDQFLDRLPGNDTKDFVAAKTHVDRLIAAAQTAGTTTPLDRAAIQRNLDSVYQQVKPPATGGIRNFISDLRRAAGDLLSRILSSLFSNRGPVTIFGWALVLIAVTVVFLVARRVRRSIVPHRSRDEESGRRLERTDWRKLAAEARARGDAREAARCLYHAMLEDFASSGVIGDEPALTAGELRSAVGKERPELYQGVSRATRTFERAHFGKSDPAEPDIEHMADLERKIRS